MNQFIIISQPESVNYAISRAFYQLQQAHSDMGVKAGLNVIAPQGKQVLITVLATQDEAEKVEINKETHVYLYLANGNKISKATYDILAKVIDKANQAKNENCDITLYS